MVRTTNVFIAEASRTTRIKHWLFASLIFSTMMVCQSVATADQLALPSGDLVAPVVEHEPTSEPVNSGSEYPISVKVTDNKGVKSVLLFYRTIGSADYNRVLMNSMGDDKFGVTLQSDIVATPGIEYYIQAEDLAGNTLLHGYSFSPLIVKVIGASGNDNGDDRTVSETALVSNVGTTSGSGAASGSILTNKWLWIGLGVLAAAAASSGGGDDPAPTTASVTITANAPQ